MDHIYLNSCFSNLTNFNTPKQQIMKKILYYLFFCLPLFLSAQMDESDTLKVKASLSLTGFWQRGNVEASIFRGRSDLSIRPWEKLVFKTTNSYVYQAFGGQKADEDILSLNFLYFNPEKRIHPLVLGFASSNYRREIDSRYIVGGGVTYQALGKKNRWLKFSLTCEYESTDFGRATFNNADYNGNRSINTFRGTLWVNGKYHFFKKKIILTHESYVQPSLENSNNYRWWADVSLELPISKRINFKINYLDSFESIVIENQKQDDGFLTFGLTLKSV